MQHDARINFCVAKRPRSPFQRTTSCGILKKVIYKADFFSTTYFWKFLIDNYCSSLKCGVIMFSEAADIFVSEGGM